MDDLQPLADLAVGVGLGGESGAGQRVGIAAQRAAFDCKHIGRRRRPQIVNQLTHRGETNRHAVRIDHGEAKACPHQKVTRGADIDLRMNARRGTTAHMQIGGKHRLLELRQTARTGEGGQQKAIGAKRAPDQGERAGKIVDAVERARGKHEVEGGVGEGQPVLVALHSTAVPRESVAGICARHRHALLA